MAAAPQLERRYTAEEFLALEEAIGFELDDGVLVERGMSYLSSRVAAIIAGLIGPFADRLGLGETLLSEIGLQIFPDRPHRIPRADVVFVRKERLTAAIRMAGFLTIPPDLVVEVVSPGDTATYLRRKVREYLLGGVNTVWVVYPETREVIVHRRESTDVLGEGDTLDGGDAVPGFSCPVAELFPTPE